MRSGKYKAVTVAAAVTLAAVLAVAGCGGAHPNAPAATTQANRLTCQHYLKQYAWKQGLAFSTVADAVKWMEYVTADSFTATPGTKLAHDLGEEVAAMRGKPNSYKNGTVYRDCGGSPG